MDNSIIEVTSEVILPFFFDVFSFLEKNKQVPWLGRENKSNPWQARNLQKYNKKKQEYNNK